MFAFFGRSHGSADRQAATRPRSGAAGRRSRWTLGRHCGLEPLENRDLLSAAPISNAVPTITASPADAPPASHPWRNAVNLLDVNNNGTVAPIDALQVINELIANGIHALGNPPIAPAVPPPYYDVVADGIVSPLDAAQVVNELIARGSLDGSGAPASHLVIAGSGFNAATPPTVTFSDAAGYSVNAAVLSVKSDSVETAVPAYFDFANLQFRSGRVTVTVTNGADQHVAFSNFLIQDLPQPLPTPGQLTSVFLRSLEGLTNLALVDFQTIKAASASVDVTNMIGTLKFEESDLIAMRGAVDSLMAGTVDHVDLVKTSNNVQLTLTKDGLAVIDRQIAGWVKNSLALSGTVSVSDVRDYFNAFVDDVRLGRSTGNSSAVDRARAHFAQMLDFSADVTSLSAGLKNAITGSAALETAAPSAALQFNLAVTISGLVSVADLEIVANETRVVDLGDFTTTYPATLTYLEAKGVFNLFNFQTVAFADLAASPADGAGDILNVYPIETFAAINQLQSPAPTLTGPLGTAIEDNIFEIWLLSPPYGSGVNEALGSAALTTTEAGGTATFRLQLASKPTAPVTIQFTSSKPTEATVTTSITIDPIDWQLLHEVVVTGVDNGMRDGSVSLTISMLTTSTDLSYNNLQPTAVPVTHDDPVVV